MHMIDLPLDAAALTRFAWRRGHGGGQAGGDEDFGYAAHAWLAAALGPLAPRPFRLVESKRSLRLLGYTQSPLEALKEHADTFAEPDAFAVCDWSTAAGKEMPSSWTSGRLLGFEVRVCPVIRGELERDLYLVEVEEAKRQGRAAFGRDAVYAKWLQRQFEHENAALMGPGDAALCKFRRVLSLRRSRGCDAPSDRRVERPDALFTGALTVGDPVAFGRLLARGVGRHRAFGFGMLLLRPLRANPV